MTARMPSELLEAVGAEIRELRDRFYHGDSFELGAVCGWSRASVYGWIRCVNLPSTVRLKALIGLCEEHGMECPAMRRAFAGARPYTSTGPKSANGQAVARFDERGAKCLLRVGPPGGAVKTPGGRRLPLDRVSVLEVASLCLDCQRPVGECAFQCLRKLPAGAEFVTFIASKSEALFYKILVCPRFRPPKGFGDVEKRRKWLSRVTGGLIDEEDEKEEKKRCV